MLLLGHDKPHTKFYPNSMEKQCKIVSRVNFGQLGWFIKTQLKPPKMFIFQKEGLLGRSVWVQFIQKFGSIKESHDKLLVTTCYPSKIPFYISI